MATINAKAFPIPWRLIIFGFLVLAVVLFKDAPDLFPTPPRTEVEVLMYPTTDREWWAEGRGAYQIPEPLKRIKIEATGYKHDPSDELQYVWIKLRTACAYPQSYGGCQYVAGWLAAIMRNSKVPWEIKCSFLRQLKEQNCCPEDIQAALEGAIRMLAAEIRLFIAQKSAYLISKSLENYTSTLTELENALKCLKGL